MPSPVPLGTDEVTARLRAAGCVFAEDEAALLVAEAGSDADLRRMVQERVAGTPLEQVVGWARFCGLRIAVDPGVFVPRRRTELLAREATRSARAAVEGADPGGQDLRPVVVELCCGSGAVSAVVLAALGDQVELHAADIDPAAVRCARRNVVGPNARVQRGDLYQPLAPSLCGQVDVLVANAPYVPTDEIRLMPVEARDHEPTVALDGGPDGLDVARRIAGSASKWLSDDGQLLIETSARQAPQLSDVLAGYALTVSVVTSLELDATVVIGSMGARPRELGVR